MSELNNSNNWHNICVDTSAEFIVYADSQADAFDKTIGYCNDNKFLGLDPEMMLNHGVWAKPLNSETHEYYSIVNNRAFNNTVRLVYFKESSKDKETITELDFTVDPSQLALFSIDRRRNSQQSLYQYSY